MTVALADRPKGRANSFDPATVLAISSELQRHQNQKELDPAPHAARCTLTCAIGQPTTDATKVVNSVHYNHVYVIRRHPKVEIKSDW
jgi:hypothetical protein